MIDPVVLVGVGQMGAVFAHGILRTGRPIIPVTRSQSLSSVAQSAPDPSLVLVTVGENDLDAVLDEMPDRWRERVGLLQNELLPKDWQAKGYRDPTVMSVWFEKKRGMDTKVLLPTLVFGPHADLIASALGQLDIPSVVLPNEEALVTALVQKNLYILTLNLAGLVSGKTVRTLWNEHRDLAEEVAAEVLDIQEALVGSPLDRPRLLSGLSEAIHADLEHKCRGRSAEDRLARALANADALGLEVPALRRIRSSL